MKTKEIRDLIDFIAETGLNEVNIETEELKLSVKRSAEIQTQQMLTSAAAPAISAPVAVAAPAPAAKENPENSAENSNYVEVKSPMIGTFYRSANPESAPFVAVGDSISAGQTVCIIEAMKLFNEIETEVSGTIVKMLVDNATPVEYDQPLYLVDPS